MTTAAASSSVMVPQGRGGMAASFGPGAGTTPAFDKDNSPSFSDLIDVINPLQHIPVVNTIYRAITGDHESAFADVIGGTLYGGPVGAGLAIADLGLRDATGKTVGEHAMAWMGIGDGGANKASDTAVAQASQPAAQVAAATQAKTLVASPAAMKTANAGGQSSAQKKSNSAGNGPTLTPAALIPNETVQAADGATPAIVPSSSPYAAPAKAAMDEAGPATQSGYLVFGGAATAGQSAMAAPAANTMTVASAAAPDNTNATSAKNFATLGAGTAPAATLPPAPATPAAPQMAANTPASKMFRVPPRNGPAAPPQNLPPPTTGPGALPGGKSMALSAQEAQMAATQQDPQHNFLTAYTQALDKYRSAQRLGTQQQQTTGTDTTSDVGAPSNLLQPTVAVTPLDASDADSAVTLH